MIKARACAGDIAAGEAILNDLSPFVWRKYLDFAAVADVHAMKRQINAYRGHGEIAVEGHNIKLGRGGIREIEFFAQTQQLIAGGRNPAFARPRHAHHARQAERRPLDRRGRARRHESRLLSSCARSSTGCRWSMTSRRKRCRPSARSSSVSRAFSATPTATPSPRFCSGISTRCSATIRACSKRRPAPTSRRWRFRPTPTTARRWTGWPSSASARRWRPRRIVRHWLAGGHRSLKGEVARSHLEALLPVLLEQLARTDNRRRHAGAVRSFPRQSARRGAAVVAAAAKPDLIALITLGARHCAAARRYAGAQSAGDGCAGRSELFRHLAGRRGARPAARRGAGAIALRRGPARTHPHVRAGIHVPDRRADFVRHGDGAAGGRGLRAAGRRGDPRRASRGRRTISPPPTAICAARRPRCWPWASSAAAR